MSCRWMINIICLAALKMNSLYFLYNVVNNYDQIYKAEAAWHCVYVWLCSHTLWETLGELAFVKFALCLATGRGRLCSGAGWASGTWRSRQSPCLTWRSVCACPGWTPWCCSRWPWAESGRRGPTRPWRTPGCRSGRLPSLQLRRRPCCPRTAAPGAAW